MKHKRENGGAVINALLIIIILILCTLVFFAVISNQTTVNNTENTTITDIIPTKNTTQNNIMQNTVPDVELSNEILSAGTIQQPKQVSFNENYYYKQLSNDGKRIYNVLKSNINAFRSGNDTINIGEMSKETGNEFQGCWDAFSLDHPELFYIETDNVSLLTKTTSFLGNSKYEYFIKPKNEGTYYSSAWNNKSQVESAIIELDKKVQYIVEKTTLYSSRYDKIKCVHDYIIENCEYDKNSGINRSNIYGCLVQGKAICEGYADSLKYILDKLSIPCVVACGDGIGNDGNSEFHAWNYVQMENGEWYAVDVTWDDPIIIGSGKIPQDVRYKYFMVGSNSFLSTHQEDGDVSGTGQSFRYPQISTTNY